MIDSLAAAALDFANHVATETTQKARLNLCIAQKKELIKTRSTVASARRYLTVYRAAIIAHPQIQKNAALLRSLRIPKAANKKIQTQYETKVQLRTERGDYTLISRDTVPQIIDKAISFLGSESRYKVAAGLLILTGRRTAEVFFTGKLAPVKGAANRAFFSGQLKKRKGQTVADNKPYSIPVLTSAKAVISALDWLHLQYSGLIAPKKLITPTPVFENIADVNKRVSRDLGQTVKKEFGDLLGADVKPHDLRKIYIAIAFFLAGDNGKTSFRNFAKKALGHTDSVAGLTSEAYNKYKII